MDAMIVGALAGAGLRCVFETASIDGRPAFDSAVTLTLQATSRADLVEMTSPDLRPRLFRMGTSGVWATFVNDEVLDFGRTAVIDVRPDGFATFVTNQQGMAAEMISREGTCAPAGEG